LTLSPPPDTLRPFPKKILIEFYRVTVVADSPKARRTPQVLEGLAEQFSACFSRSSHE